MALLAPILATIASVAGIRDAVWNGSHVGETFDVVCTVVAEMDNGNPDHTAYAIADDTGSAYVKSSGRLSLVVGSVSRLVGHISVDEYSWQHAFFDSAETKSEGVAATPVSATAPQLSDAAFDSRLVSMRGIVSDIITDEIDPRWKFVLFRSDEGPFVAAIATDSPSLAQLVGATVSAKGIANSLPYVGRRSFMTPQLLVYAPSDFTVISPALNDPFSAPRISDDAMNIKNVLYKSPVELSKTGIRRADGRVIAVARGRRVFFRSAGGRLCSADLKDDETPPACGEAVAVAGFPDTDLFILNFARASCRTLSGEEAAALHVAAEETPPSRLPPDFDMDKILRDYYGYVVTLRGTVFAAPSYDGKASTMNLLCGGRIVQVDVTSCHETAAVIAPGSEVEATGLCVINTTTWNPLHPFPRIDQFTIVTRSCGDVVVVRTPPWWTPARLAAVIAALFAVLIALYGWNYILRRIIRRRERQLVKSEIAQTEADLRVDERTRLAAEIHDALSQTLTGVSFQLDAANKTLSEDPVSAARFLAVAKRTLLSCREELRRCLWDLRNDTLGESDFSEAVRRTIRPSIGSAELAVRFEIRRQRVSDSTAHAVLSIARELASNAARHGGARHVRVAGEMQSGKIRFSVRDDGRGFDTANRPGPNEGHFGLQGIKERIARLGGSMKIESAPGVGTKVTVEIGK